MKKQTKAKVALGLARAQLGYFKGISAMLWGSYYLRKPLSDAGFTGTEGGN